MRSWSGGKFCGKRDLCLWLSCKEIWKRLTRRAEARICMGGKERRRCVSREGEGFCVGHAKCARWLEGNFAVSQ